MKKKHIATILRLAIAVLGITYIIWKVDWVDQVEIPSRTTLPDGRVLEQESRFKVVSKGYDPVDIQTDLVIQVAVADGQPVTMTVPHTQIDAKAGTYRFVPGIITTLKHARFGMLSLGLLVVAIMYPILTIRWWLLMRARGMAVPLSKAFRLTMVGNFFNFCMPGTTGGDVIKAYYAAKGSGRRADAVMSVVIDRVCGLLGLLVLAGLAGLFMLGNDLAREVTLYVWGICSCVVAGAAIYFSAKLRAAFRIDALLQKLPGKELFTAIDQAAFAYRDHKALIIGAIAMSMILHASLITATTLAGYALGLRTPVGLLMVVIPVSFLVGAIPIAPQGIGVMEFFAVTMLQSPVAMANQIVGMLIMIRLYQVFYSMLGSVFLLKGDIHLHPQDSSPPLDVAVPSSDSVTAA